MTGVALTSAVGWGWLACRSHAAEVADGDVSMAEAAMREPRATQDDGLTTTRLRRQLEELNARMAVLEQALATEVSRVSERVSADSRMPADDEADALLAAIERARGRREHAQLATLSDTELRQRSGWLVEHGHDMAGALRALEELLTRQLAPEDRGNALAVLGGLQFASADFAAAISSQQAAVEFLGSDTDAGRDAARALLQTLQESGDLRRALAVADSLIQNQRLPDWQRMNDRFTAARLAQDLGDRERARSDFKALLNDCASEPRLASLKEMVVQSLKGL